MVAKSSINQFVCIYLTTDLIIMVNEPWTRAKVSESITKWNSFFSIIAQDQTYISLRSCTPCFIYWLYLRFIYCIYLCEKYYLFFIMYSSWRQIMIELNSYSSYSLKSLNKVVIGNKKSELMFLKSWSS